MPFFFLTQLHDCIVNVLLRPTVTYNLSFLSYFPCEFSMSDACQMIVWPFVVVSNVKKQTKKDCFSAFVLLF